MKQIKVVGIMNGTSLDGVDFVLTDIQQGAADVKIKFLDEAYSPFPVKLKKQLTLATEHKLKVDELARLHHELGRFYSQQLQKIEKNKKWKFELIGLHGQTVFHEPPHATLQIGESSYLSHDLNRVVVADFRVADLASGGQGAPIASLFHQVALAPQIQKKSQQPLCVHNLGGISNLTYIAEDGEVKHAFDTGPANMLIDLYMQKTHKKDFDKNGDFAARGIPHQYVVEYFLKTTKYFQQKPPKSCGKEQFGKAFLDQFIKKMGRAKKEDIMASLVELTARSIAHAYTNYLPQTPAFMVLCGGGAKNKYLKSRIQYHLPKTIVTTTEDFGWPLSSIEGAAFALLAAYRIWGIPSNIPATTGAKHLMSLGKIS